MKSVMKRLKAIFLVEYITKSKTVDLVIYFHIHLPKYAIKKYPFFQRDKNVGTFQFLYAFLSLRLWQILWFGFL